mmetsp:Transcript_11151/g.23266  ORF Transcript_11151/g.23266 Transcript_11151/m.23266 type:complete len:230 (-) Transcript_11151:384-1073(-)
MSSAPATSARTVTGAEGAGGAPGAGEAALSWTRASPSRWQRVRNSSTRAGGVAGHSARLSPGWYASWLPLRSTSRWRTSWSWLGAVRRSLRVRRAKKGRPGPCAPPGVGCERVMPLPDAASITATAHARASSGATSASTSAAPGASQATRYLGSPSSGGSSCPRGGSCFPGGSGQRERRVCHSLITHESRVASYPLGCWSSPSPIGSSSSAPRAFTRTAKRLPVTLYCT